MAAPTNTTAATAIAIAALPATITQQVDDAGTTYTVWYKYVAVSGDNEIGLWAFGDLSVYKPTLTVWTGPVSSLVQYLIGGALNKPAQIPVTPLTTYYLRIAPNVGNPSPANLTLSVLAHADMDVPAGALAVNDDTVGFPLVLASATVDETVLRFVPGITSGSGADILPNATLLLSDDVNGAAVIYDGAYAVKATVADPFGTGDAPVRVNSNKTDTFYIGSNAGKVTTVSQSGTKGPTTWDLADTGVLGIGPSPDETILYFTAAGESKIKRFDLVSNAPLSDLTALAAAPGTDLLVLSDGSVIVPVPSTDQILRYSAAGVLLTTYSVTGLEAADRLAYDQTDATFWVWLGHGVSDAATAASVFKQIKVSDGTVLTTRTHSFYAQGIYRRTATATPTARFGMSESCPFWLTRVIVQPKVVFPVEEVPKRWLRRSPHLSTEQMMNFYPYFQLDMQVGVGNTNDPGRDPVVMFNQSSDGGYTWDGEEQLGVGEKGQYLTRVMAFGLNAARDKVFQVSGSDPVPTTLVAAYLGLIKGMW